MAPNSTPGPASANGSVHVNGNHAPTATSKRGHVFQPSCDWKDRVCVEDQVYSKRRIDCSEEEWRARVDLAAAYRLCHFHKLNEGIVNHLTVRVPGTTDRFLVFPFGLMWNEVTASNLLLVDESGKVISGIGEPEATAFWIHAPIHQHHPDAACVMHTHQPEISALCAQKDQELPMIHQNCQFFYDDISYDSYNGLVLDGSEGKRLADVMGDKHVLMHQNHGVMVTGATVAVTFYRLYFLEQAARIVNKALSIGRPLRTIPDQVCADTAKCLQFTTPEYGRLFFEAGKRQLLKSEDRDFWT